MKRRFRTFFVMLLMLTSAGLVQAAMAAEVAPQHAYSVPPAVGVMAVVLGLGMAFKIGRAIRYGGAVYGPGDEKAFLAAAEDADVDPDYERLREADAIEGEPPESPADTDLDSADFASKAGFELASESGLTPDDFDGVSPSGETGYTKADVEGVLEGREE